MDIDCFSQVKVAMITKDKQKDTSLVGKVAQKKLEHMTYIEKMSSKNEW